MSTDNETCNAEITAADWRARAKHIRDLAIGVMDDLTIARMEELARASDENAARADAAAGRCILPDGDSHDCGI